MVKGLLTLLVTANTKGFDSALGKTGNKLKGFRSTMSSVTKVMGSFGLALGVVEVLRDAGQKILKFDKAMVGLAAILGKTRGEINALEKQSISLAATTIFTANQVADMMTTLARFGFDPTEIENSSKAILDLAAAADIELSTAVDVAASTMRAFNLESEQMGRVVDVMTNAFTNSALDVESFGEAMKYAAPLAAAAGVSIEETSAMLGLLADNGLRGSIAGTSLRRIFTELQESGKSISQVFREAGGNTDYLADQLGFADDAVGKYALSSFVILANNAELIEKNAEAWSKLGTAEQIAEQQLTSLAGSQKILASQWESFILRIESGTSVIGAVWQDAIRSAGKFLEVLQGIGDLIMLRNPFYVDQDAIDQAKLQVDITEEYARALKDVEDVKRIIKKNDEQGVFTDLEAELAALGGQLDTYRALLASDPDNKKYLSTIESLEDKWNSVYTKVLNSVDQTSDKQKKLYKESLGYVEKERVVWNDLLQKWQKKTFWVKEVSAEERKAQAARKRAAEESIRFDKEYESWRAKQAGLEKRITYEYNEQLGAMEKIESLVRTSEWFNQRDMKPIEFKLSEMSEDDTQFKIPEIEEILEKNRLVADSYAMMAQSVSASLAQGADSWEQYGEHIGQTLVNMLADYAMFIVDYTLQAAQLMGTNQAMAISGVLANVATTISTLPPWAFLAIPAMAGLAIGLIKTAFSSNKPRAMADGGIAYGTTYAMVGEYASAGRDPEVVAPLSKLKGMLGDTGGATHVTGEFKLRNRTLVAAIERETKRSNRYGG